jgi:gliding motility-associated lipoprotein GldH
MKTLAGKNAFIGLFIAALLLYACNGNRVYDRFEAIPNAVWAYNKPLEFKVDITDTNQVCNVYINLRHKSLYTMSNLYMFVTTSSPSGQMVTDTVEFILADKSGKWLGSGLSDLLTYKRIYKRNVRFGEQGTYTFKLQQAMRVDNLPNITDAGICVEKVK